MSVLQQTVARRLHYTISAEDSATFPTFADEISCTLSNLASEGEVEIDCSERPVSLPSPASVNPDSDGARKTEALSAGYLTQEVEGIGGVVKKKVKRRIKVGATVWEFDDERGSGNYLEREASGRERSWCGWCGRIVKGQRDREVYGDDCFMI